MKKLLFLICLSITLITSLKTIAYDTTTYCANGKGNSIKAPNGKIYCLSRIGMNWWSANAWCNAIGMTLINLTEDCECSGDKCDQTADCSNLKGVADMTAPHDIWTMSSFDFKNARYVYSINGSILHASKSHAGARALCK